MLLYISKLFSQPNERIKMPRGKSKKFFIYADPKRGHLKGKRLMGINHDYEGGVENLTIQDLVDFFNENEISLSYVKLPTNFITTVKV